MSSTMIDKDRLEELATELAKGVKTESDLSGPLGELMKLTLEKALNAEMDNHLGYEKHSVKGRNKKNSRNGFGSKRLITDSGELEIEVPRDRDSDFEPQIIKKRQIRPLDAVFPKTKIQLCIVHMVRNSFKYVSYKHRKELSGDLKKIYSSVTMQDAENELDIFAGK